jgi:hypothetical protein
MKMLFALLLCPFLSFAQSKGDTKIIITAPDSTGLFNKVALALYEKGFSLLQKDQPLQMIATEKVTKWTHIKANAFVKGNQVTLSGSFDHLFTVAVDFEPIVYRGMKGSAYRTTFAELQAIADAIGGEIRYGK